MFLIKEGVGGKGVTTGPAGCGVWEGKSLEDW